MNEIYVICHLWPNYAGYTVMPTCYRNKEDADTAVQWFATHEKEGGIVLTSETEYNGAQHGYVIKRLEL